MEPKRPNNIPGYVHPTSNAYSRNSMYKTFTEGQKPKKKEKFGVTSVGRSYVTNKTLENEESEENICPICSSKTIKICTCVYNDRICSQGHIWYINRNDGKVKMGNPHKNQN